MASLFFATNFFMNPITCLQKLKYVGPLTFATIDQKNHPQVRVIRGIHICDHALYFFATRGGDFAKEILSKPYIQAMGLTQFNEMIRVSGPAQEIQGEDAVQIKQRIFSHAPELTAFYPPRTRELGMVFGLEDIVIDYFNWSSMPCFRESYQVGYARPQQNGYLITDACIECGQCLYVCPQQVIEEGTPYEIEQQHCIHCGACYESCPANAIICLADQN